MARLEAVIALYALTAEGQEIVRAMDLRQMWGQPLFFKSSGFFGWAAIGEAKPLGLIHELSHSYWGAFPVRGLPELEWDVPEGPWNSPAMDRYHEDILTFLGQPPDHFEVLRARLRDPPGATEDGPGVLFHNAEADVVSASAGGLNLIPPILRKYWHRFIGPGEFRDWYEALAWYQGLEPEERALANKYIGFNHLDLKPYRSLKSEDPENLDSQTTVILLQEEQQRLRDFAQQFQSFQLAPEEGQDHSGWRAYLRAMLALHSRHPGELVSLGDPIAGDLAKALDFISSLDKRTPEHKSVLVREEIADLPLLEYLLPILDNRTLVSLFATEPSLPSFRALKGTFAFMQLVEQLAPEASDILSTGQRKVTEAADKLQNALSAFESAPDADLRLFLDLLKDSNHETTTKVVSALADSTLRQLLERAPAQLRFILEPPRLLGMLGIAENGEVTAIIDGIQGMMENTSGASRVDAAFVEAMYQVVATIGERDQPGALQIIGSQNFPLDEFINMHPETASLVLASDLDATIALVSRGDRIRQPPGRLIYTLIDTDPELASMVVAHLSRAGAEDIAINSLAQVAYDSSRLATVPGLPISLEADGRFFAALLEQEGPAWLQVQLSMAVDVYRQRIADAEVAADFLTRYRETLEAAAATLPQAEAGEALRDLIQRAFSEN